MNIPDDILNRYRCIVASAHVRNLVTSQEKAKYLHFEEDFLRQHNLALGIVSRGQFDRMVVSHNNYRVSGKSGCPLLLNPTEEHNLVEYYKQQALNGTPMKAAQLTRLVCNFLYMFKCSWYSFFLTIGKFYCNFD